MKTTRPEYVDLDGLLDRKIAGARLYASQIEHTFGPDERMVGQFRERAAFVGGQSRSAEPPARSSAEPLAERYWRLASV